MKQTEMSGDGWGDLGRTVDSGIKAYDDDEGKTKKKDLQEGKLIGTALNIVAKVTYVNGNLMQN